MRDRTLRIGLVLGTSAGGVGRHVRALAQGLRALGQSVLVAGPAGTDETFHFRETGARFAPVAIADRPRPLADAPAVARLRSLLRGADLVHAHGVRAGALVGVATLGMRKAPRLVVTVHNAPPRGRAAGLAYELLERVVIARADAILAVSSDLEGRLAQRGARQVGHAIVPAPPSAGVQRGRDEVRGELDLDREEQLVVVAARLADQKGLPLLLDAAAVLGARRPRPLVVVAGDGPLEREVRDRIARDGLPVRLLGRRGDVPDLFAAADVAVCPSVWEGQPLVVQEALRAGAPLVATAVGGTPETMGGAGVLVPADDPEALAAAIGVLLDDPQRRAQLTAAALRRAAQLPTDADAVSQVLSLYRRLLA